MKLTEEQYQSVRAALINNSVFDNIRLWIQDGQVTEDEMRTLVKEIFDAVEDK